jgi:hypothetical protein
MITCDCCGQKTNYYKRIVPESRVGLTNISYMMRQEGRVLCENCYANYIQAANEAAKRCFANAMNQKLEGV